MAITIYLEEVEHQTCFAPLAVLGHCITRTELLKPVWANLSVHMRQHDHSVQDKLQDVLVAIMAGCRSLGQVNTRLRPERALAQAWQRPQFAEQSNLSRTLDALGGEQIEQLRAGHLALLRQHSQLRHHNWEQHWILDIDTTSLVTSKRAEGSRKGWVSGQRNQYCRHVIRFMVAGYHENLLSLTYPGDRHGYEYVKPALQQLLHHWNWSREQCHQIILRSDAEQGTDQNVRYILWLGFQVLMKAYSGRRTQAWVKRVAEEAWVADPADRGRWVAPAPVKLRMGRRLDAHLLRWLDGTGKPAFATLLTTLPYPAFTQWALYDGRGAAEVEIRADKSGLNLAHRRKHSLDAQEAWIILTDVAHNLLAWLHPWMLADSAFASFGPQRLVFDLLNIPGQLFFEDGRLIKVALWQTHPYAAGMAECLQKLLKTFDLD
ncbi:MAG: transposase [Gemmatales bacterium]|nr:transposase [Gemmatales bacterium]MCX7680718.1 transposase [Anaerolineae bacterium]